MPRSTSLEPARYQALKRTAASKPTTDEERLKVLDAQTELLGLDDWKGKTLFVKTKTDKYGNTAQRLSKSRSLRDVVTGKDRAKTDAVQRLLLEIARPLKAVQNLEASVKALEDALKSKEEIKNENKALIAGTRPATARYYGETDNYLVLRQAHSDLAGALRRFITTAEAARVIAAANANGNAKPGDPPPADGQPIPQPVAPAKVPDTKVSLYGHYPDPVYCGPAPQKGKPRFSDTTTRDRAALAVYRYLSGKPQVPPGLLRVTAYGNGDSYFEVVPETAAIHPEDAKAGQREFARFFHDLCQAYVDDPDASEGIHRLAAGGMNIAAQNLKSGQDLENNPAMVEIFARLARIEPQETPRQKGVAAQAPSPVVAMVDANDRRNVHTNSSTPAALLKSLIGQPGTAGYVLRSSVDNGGAVYVEAIPSADNPLTGAQAPADKRTCVLLANVARDYLTHPDGNVRKEAQKLRELALRSYRENRAIRNGPALHTMLAALTPPPQPKAPTIKPVAQTAPAPRRVTPWVECGSYTSGNPSQLKLKPGSLTQLINLLAKTPKNSVLEVGIGAHSGQVSVRARYPQATNEEPYGETTDDATRQFFLDLISYYRAQNKGDKKVFMATGALYNIVSQSDRQGQGQKAISNSQEMQEILTVLAGAG